MIAGFIAPGPQLKSVVIRGLGPGLRGLGITNALADPTIEIHNSQGQLMQSNAGWQTDPTSQLYVQIFGLVPSNTSDSALYEQLGPGSYTVILRSASGATGVGLIEVYDVDQ